MKCLKMKYVEKNKQINFEELVFNGKPIPKDLKKSKKKFPKMTLYGKLMKIIIILKN